MAFRVLYSDSDHIYDLSANPATKSILNSGGLQVELGGAATKSAITNDEITVFNATVGVDIKSVMDNGSVYSANTADETSARLSSEGKVLVNEAKVVNSYMNASGVSFVNGANTASFASADGITFDSSPAKYDDGAGATLEVSGSQVLFSANAGDDSSSMGALQVSVGNGTANKQSILRNGELAFGPIAGSLPLPEVKLSSADGVSIQSGPFQPDELWDSTGSAGTDGQYLLSAGAGLPPIWTTVSASATPNLSSVLGVASAGDAANQSISNLSSVGFQPSSAGQTALAITAGASSKAGSVTDVMALNYAVDATSGRPFTNQYVEIKVSGTSYWMPLYGVPDEP
jgi:hypothetical protein